MSFLPRGYVQARPTSLNMKYVLIARARPLLYMHWQHIIMSIVRTFLFSKKVE